MGQARITISTEGIGEGADVNLLEEIARIGNGRHYFTDDALSIHPRFSPKKPSQPENPPSMSSPSLRWSFVPIRHSRISTLRARPCRLGTSSREGSRRPSSSSLPKMAISYFVGGVLDWERSWRSPRTPSRDERPNGVFPGAPRKPSQPAIARNGRRLPRRITAQGDEQGTSPVHHPGHGWAVRPQAGNAS
jgi:hypothetical protein